MTERELQLEGLKVERNKWENQLVEAKAVADAVQHQLDQVEAKIREIECGAQMPVVEVPEASVGEEGVSLSQG